MTDVQNKQVVYLPPDANLIETLARQACATLADQDNPSLCDADMVDGLTEFLTEVAGLTAKALTEKKMKWLTGSHGKHQMEERKGGSHA